MSKKEVADVTKKLLHAKTSPDKVERLMKIREQSSPQMKTTKDRE